MGPLGGAHLVVWSPKAGLILGPGSGSRASVRPLVAALPPVNTRPPEGAPRGPRTPPKRGQKGPFWGPPGGTPEKGRFLGFFGGPSGGSGLAGGKIKLTGV